MNISISKKPPYLPEVWDNDIEMSGLMSFLKARHTNPTHYDRVIDFWKNMIASYCTHEKTCVFTLDELKMKFRRGSQIPSPLPSVISELTKNGTLSTRDDFDRNNQGWFEWGITFVNPISWINSYASVDLTKSQIVHTPTLRSKAMELLEFYRTGYNMTECPEIVAYDELRSAASNIVNRDSFGLVVNELIRRGEVSLGHSRDGERVLKFKDNNTMGPAKFTETDANVHELRRTMNRLDHEIKKCEQKEITLKDEAKAAMLRKDKKSALSIMRKVARLRKELTDKDVQYQRLLGMLEQLAQSKQTKEIIEVYKAGSKAFKETLARQGLTLENVDGTVESINELISDYGDIEETLRCGFSTMSHSDSIDEAELESELNELIEDTKEEEKADQKEPKTKFPISANSIRVGKRILDLELDLPEVPSAGPSFSKESLSTNGNVSLEERWKRLRMEAS